MGAAPLLTILRDGEVVKKQNLDGEIVVGRSEGCVIRLEDRAISRQHALFRPVGDGFQVEKKSEFGPLVVNGAEVTRAFLKEGDVVGIGPYLVKYTSGEGGAAAPPVPGGPSGVAMMGDGAQAPLQLLQSVEVPTVALPPQEPSTAPAPTELINPTAAAAAAIRAEAGAAPGPEGRKGDANAGELGGELVLGGELSGLLKQPGDSSVLLQTDQPAPPANEGSFLLNAPPAEGVPGLGGMAPPVEGVQAVEGGPVGGVGDISMGSVGLSPPNLEATPSSSTGPVDQEASTKVLNSADLKVKILLKAGVASCTELDVTTDEISIGRGRDCEIIVDDKKVSRKNTIIKREGNKYIIKDLESANGTYVNGAQVKEMQLFNDDVIKIGNSEFKFVAQSEAYAKRAEEFSQIAAAAVGAGQAEISGLSVPDINLPPPTDGGSAPIPQSNMPPLAVASDGSLGMGSMSSPPPPRSEMTNSGIMRPIQPATGMSGLFPTGAARPMGAEKTINVLGIPGLGSAMPGATPAKADKGIMAKFRRLPKRKQWIVIALVIAGSWTLLWDDEEVEVPQPKRNGKVTKKVDPKAQPSPAVAQGTQTQPGGTQTGEKPPEEKASPAFENLSPEKQRYVEAQHNLSFDYYRNKEYGKALYEIQKIFDLIPDYKDSREIERYSKEGKRKQDALDEEKRKRDEEARTKAKIAELVDEAATRMRKKQYEQAREVFPRILALDPDNAAVAGWKKEIEEWEEKSRLAEQEKQIQKEINDKAWGTYKHGLALKRQRRYHTAIVVFTKLAEEGTSDPRLVALSRRMAVICRALITARRKPVFAQAAEAEKNGEWVKSMRLYARAAAIDPSYGPSRAGLDRVKKVLHDKAKNIYTEAVLAESYSDFETAKAKYKEILAMAPSDDLYFERASRKMNRYFQRAIASEQQ